MLRTLARRSAGVAAAGAAGTVAYAHYDDGFGRQCKFWRTVGPAVVHYTYISKRHKQSDAETRKAAFAKLHERYAATALGLILELRGLFTKFGQAAASSPFVPTAYRAQFKQLQSDVPSEDFALIRRVVEEELGPLDRNFSHFSESACGAASIGQAHVATLHSGEEVVVKVQYPDAARVFAADVRCLRALVWLSQPEALPTFAEFESQLALELDFGKELENLTAIRDAVMPRYADRVAVPAAHRALCSPRVLTMERLAGPKLEGEVRRQMAAIGMRIDESESMRDWLVRLDAQQQQQGGGDGAGEAAEAESRWQRWRRGAVRLVGLDSAIWLADRVLSLRGGARGAAERPQRSAEEMRASLRVLVEVHGFEMFSTGLFNADPHPGNLIAMDDGRVGLIDYGQCKRLAPEPRRAIAELMVKVADDAPAAEVAAAFRRVGVRTEKGGDEFLSKLARLMFGRVTLEMLEPKWHRELHRSDKVAHFPPDLLMVHRVALILRGLSVALRYNLAVAEVWRPFAAGLLDGEER